MLLLLIVLTSAIGWFINLVAKGWKARGLVDRRVFVSYRVPAEPEQPMPKHNILFGHLLAIKLYVDKFTSGAHPFLALGQVPRGYAGGIYYLDMGLLVVLS